MSDGVRVEGITSLVRSLQAMGVSLEDVRGAFARIAEKGASIASALAPKDTGALAASVRGNRAKNKATIAAGNGTTIPYAAIINYGDPNRGIAASLFMQRADSQLDSVSELEREINHLIRTYGL